MIDQISPAQARRIGLKAQGFGARGVGAQDVGEQGVGAQGIEALRTRRAPSTPIGARQLNATIELLGLLQLDSVNVFERSHFLPLFARLGPYDRSTLDRLTFSRKGRYVEYWAHEAALIPVETWPLFRWQMERNRALHAQPSHWAHDNHAMTDWLLRHLAERGPLAASAIDHESNKRAGPWWGWSDVKIGLEALFRRGDVVSAGRTRFERVYALPEHVLSRDILDRAIDRGEAHRRLVAIAAKAHGIGTASDIADYFRLRNDDTLQALRDLEDAGVVRPVSVAGWNRTAWLHRDARIPRRIHATALLSPFDPVVWRRERAERMFGFHYRIEIYTPAPKRVYGYYSLPLLVDDRLVGRVDLKSDRQNSVLRVQSAWVEPGAPDDTAARLAPLLRSAAAWQGLDGIEVMNRGTLAGPVAAELGEQLRPPAA